MNNLEYSATVSSIWRVLLSVTFQGRFSQFVPNWFYHRRSNKSPFKHFCFVNNRVYATSAQTAFSERRSSDELCCIVLREGRGGPARGGIRNSLISITLSITRLRSLKTALFSVWMLNYISKLLQNCASSLYFFFFIIFSENLNCAFWQSFGLIL